MGRIPVAGAGTGPVGTGLGVGLGARADTGRPAGAGTGPAGVDTHPVGAGMPAGRPGAESPRPYLMLQQKIDKH